MSRCFPYPPPGYCRNGASYEALIESIKLQKETNKTKSERKKEKRAKKEKEKRQKETNNEDEIKLQKKTNDDYHKVSQNPGAFTKAQIKGRNAATELFEKSDLTEEHGPSISSSQQPSYSSDSTQNSNKRKTDVAGLVPDSSSSHGKPIKIRFLKKHKGSDSTNFGADAKSNSYLSVLPSSSNLDGSLVSSVRKNGFPITSGTESRTLVQSKPILDGTKIADPKRVPSGRVQSAPSSVKPILQSARPQQPALPSFGRQFLSRIDDRGLCSGRQQQLASSLPQMPNLVSNNMTLNEITVSANGSSSQKNQKDTQKVGPTRFEKKMMKKHFKYEKLMESLFPPVFQAHPPGGVDDDDWLCRAKTSNSSLSKGEVETCRQLVASWQPCARFLADVDMHALPYTVPY